MMSMFWILILSVCGLIIAGSYAWIYFISQVLAKKYVWVYKLETILVLIFPMLVIWAVFSWLIPLGVS